MRVRTQGRWLVWVAGAALVAAGVGYGLTPRIITDRSWTGTDDLRYAQTMFRFCLIAAAAFAVGVAVSVARPPMRWDASRRGRWAAVAGMCVGMSWFEVHCGRHQFGGYDFNDILSVGWRQVLGQRAYLDFPASTPPLFNVGLRVSNAIFGLSWDTSLGLTAAFTCGTFVWLYALLRRLGLRGAAALAVAFATETTAMLVCCFWWYNNTTSVAAAVLFLSTLLLMRPSGLAASRVWPYASYAGALVLLSWTKPSIAGLTMLVCIATALLVCRERMRVAAWTAGAAAVSALLLVACGVSIPALMRTYLGVAGERGFGSIGFNQLTFFDQNLAVCWIVLATLPLLAVFAGVRAGMRAGGWRELVVRTFFLLATVVAVYGVATNGELAQVEYTLLVVGGGVATWGLDLGLGLRAPGLTRPSLPREGLRGLYVGLLAACVATGLYLGWTRVRVWEVGEHKYFEWDDNQREIASGPLRHMRVSGTMIAVEDQVRQALAENPGPYFFGPRLDFNNAVLGVAAEPGLPAWWHPGTAFARADEDQLVKRWAADRFRTVVLLRDDKTYLSPGLLNLLRDRYLRDDARYPRLTVYRLRGDLSRPVGE